MAEAAAVASIVGIASFGIRLTKVLYDFGSNVSSAREQTSYVARHVDLYANVLDILTERIDDEEPILSDAAFDLIEELKLQSSELFSKIEQSLPSLKDGKDDISFLQKVKWNFMKSRVALLVGELDYLRSTVHLLVTIIFTGRKIRSRSKRKAESSKDGAPDLDNDLRKQGLKAQNALLAHHDALEKLPELEKEAERRENSSSDNVSQASTQQPNTRTDVICTSTSVLAKLQQSLAAYADPTERQRVVLERSAHLLILLLQQWTTVDLSAPPGAAEQQQAQSANQQQPTATTDGPRHKNDAAPAGSSPLNHAEMHDSGYGSGTSPRTPDMGRESTPRSLVPIGAAFFDEEWMENPEKIQTNASRSSLPDHSRPAKPTDDALPPGWLKHRDPATGRFYYEDVKNHRTQWEVPSATKSDVPAFERKSTSYASTSRKRTSVGGSSQSSILQSTTGLAGLSPEEIFTQFFISDGYGADKPKLPDIMVRDPTACRACNGRGGRDDKIMACKHCSGCGFVPRMGQQGPMRPGSRVLCPECNGRGHMIKKYRCKVCNETKKQPRNSSYELEPKPHRENYYEERASQKFKAPSSQQANKGSDEDEPGAERERCASQ